MNVRSFPTLCGSVAGTASKLGVALHDAGYQELGLNFKYVAFGTDDIGTAVTGFKSLGFRGFGVSMPHKEAVIHHVDEIATDVKEIGACNTVVNDSGKLTAHNTDWRGAVDALKESGIEKPNTAVIIGSGGVARAIGFGLKKSASKVVVCSRNQEAGRAIVEDLSLAQWLPLSSQGDASADLVINATPVSNLNECPVLLDDHPKANALLDVVFSPKETELVSFARSKGLIVTPGWRMLLHQALHQFRMYTGDEPPMAQMSKVLEDAFD